MRILLIILLIGLSYYANAQDKHKSPKQDKDYPKIWHVTKNSNFTFSGAVFNTSIYFETKQDYLDALEKERKLKMWSDEEYQKKIDSYSFLKGGVIHLDIVRPTIGAANTKFFTIIIQDPQGKELFRKQLEDKIADYRMRGPSTDWYNSGFVVIKDELPTEFNVYVVDDIKSERFEFIVKQ